MTSMRQGEMLTLNWNSFHDLKRACGTLNAARMSKRVLNAFMCHRSSTTTERYYINKACLLDGHLGEMFVPNALKKGQQ